MRAVVLEREQLPRSGGRYRDSPLAAGASWKLKLPWKRGTGLRMLLIAAFWDGLLAAYYVGALQSGSVLMLVFPILHVLVGVALAYTSVAYLVNTTHVSSDTVSLSVRHGPIPWGGAVSVPLGQLLSVHLRAREPDEDGDIVHDVVAELVSISGTHEVVLLDAVDDLSQGRAVVDGLRQALELSQR